jgi:hypothetical protein
MSIFDSIISGITDLTDSIFGEGSVTASDVVGAGKALAGSGLAAATKKSSAATASATESSFGNALFKQSQLANTRHAAPTPTKVPYGTPPYSVDPSAIENKWGNILQSFVNIGDEKVLPGRPQKGY